eukprot:TRINITY_DN29938_c0_g1_i1.p1 TRINITY_DN29938_c0_g1~~TRINITY_DN29938_c0_g1_i1.p1  ORF type:complete len:620 (+),score=132.78 TRINITY_DN29938_c0_g1_i1:112-1971(+)
MRRPSLPCEVDALDSVATEPSGRQGYEILPIWVNLSNTGVKTSVRTSAAEMNYIVRSFHSEERHEQSRETFTWRMLQLNPSSVKRGLWDILSLMLVLYDLVMVPLEVFEPEETEYANVVRWIARVFWSCDMVMSFLTGYMTQEGFLEMQPQRIVRRYLTTWFFFDAALVSSDWMDTILGGGESLGYAQITRSSRSSRIIRMIRLLRIARMSQVAKLCSERLMSDLSSRLTVLAEIMGLVLLIVCYSHVMACVWWGIGMQNKEESWVAHYELEEQPLPIRYGVSLHWSLSQLTGGMDEFTPVSDSERAFACGIFVIGFMLASLFVSSLSSSMTKLHIITSGEAQQLTTLREFMTQNNVTTRLAMRVMRNAKAALVLGNTYISEVNVNLMRLISEPLLEELHMEMYSPTLVHHPFFETYLIHCPQVMKKVCHNAITRKQVFSGDVIFETGEHPAEPVMYFIRKGLMKYSHSKGTTYDLKDGEWLAEAVLWTSWTHVGRCQAESNSDLLVVNATLFREIATSFHHPLNFDLREYAAEFVKDLNVHVGELTDISIDGYILKFGLFSNAFSWVFSRSKEAVTASDKFRVSTRRHSQYADLWKEKIAHHLASTHHVAAGRTISNL